MREAKRFNLLSAGRRWFKTSLLARLASLKALEGNYTIIWGAPTFDQVNIGWTEVFKGARNVARFNETKKTVTFPSGGRIIFRSLDNPDNARGHTAHLVIMDEAADISPVAWYEVLRPMLMTTKGDAWIAGTPKGQNWFFQEHTRALARPDMMSWQIPTRGCVITENGLVQVPHPYENPAVDFSEIEDMYATLSEDQFRQEVLAEFLRTEGLVFRRVEDNLMAPTKVTPEEHRGHRIVAGIDWGQRNDFTAISVVCATCKQELVLDRFNKIEWAFQRQRVVTLWHTWNISHFLIERNSIGGPNIEALQLEGLPVYGFDTSSTSKPPLIQALALALEKQEAQWLPDEVGKRELLAYTSKVLPSGRISYSAPQGMHDDTVIARALAWKAIKDARDFVVSVFRR